MSTVLQAFRNGTKVPVLIIFLALGIFLVQPSKAFAADFCFESIRDLQGSQGVLQNKGGIWGYLERSSNLRDNSILGLQIDSKLQRLIVTFENLCEEGKTPTPKLFNLILSLLGDARMVFNRDADRQPKEKMLETLNGLSKNIDELLAQLPN